MQPPQRSSSRLEQLPTELLIQICGYLGQNHLYSLRLVCERLYSVATCHVKTGPGGTSIGLLPSSLRALQRFVETPPGQKAQFLTVWLMSYKDFMQDVRQMAAKKISNKFHRTFRERFGKPPPLPIEGTRYYNLNAGSVASLTDISDPKSRRLYYDIPSWAQPLQQFLPQLELFRIYLADCGSLPWKLSFFKQLFKHFEFVPNRTFNLLVTSKVLNFAVDWEDHMINKTAARNAVSIWSSSNVRDGVQEEISPLCSLIERGITGWPINTLSFRAMPVRISSLRQCFETIKSPSALFLKNVELDFEENPDNNAVNEGAIRGLVASLASVKRLTIQECRHRPKRTNHLSWKCFLVALRELRELKSFHLMWNQNLVVFGQISMNTEGNHIGTSHLLESQEEIQRFLKRLIHNHEVREI